MENILLIDNDYSVLSKISTQLEKSGYQVYLAQDGRKGLELTKLIQPSLIICEIELPGFNGFSILDKLYQSSETAAIPVIFVTAKFSLNDMRKAMEMGADSYLVKPIKNQVLLNVIEKKLERIKNITKSKTTENKNIVNNNENNKLKENSSLLIHIGNKPKILKLNDIEYIHVKGDYTSLYIVGSGKVIIRKSLKDWEEILPERDFIRIHRSVIININLVSNIERWYQRVYRIQLYNSREVFTTSQRYTVRIRTRLKI